MRVVFFLDVENEDTRLVDLVTNPDNTLNETVCEAKMSQVPRIGDKILLSSYNEGLDQRLEEQTATVVSVTWDIQENKGTLVLIDII